MLVSGRPAPVFGMDADEILTDMGYDKETISKLKEAGITKSRMPGL